VTAYYIAPLERAGESAAGLRIATSVLIVFGAAAIAMVAIGKADYPIIRAIEAMSTFIAVTVLAFASAFVIMSQSEPTAFSELLDHTGALYFTLTTVTTIGYGDIAPKSEPARIAVMVQMMTNVLIVGVGLRLMVNTAKRRAMTL
jgi:voltage-gated potassium channel